MATLSADDVRLIRKLRDCGALEDVAEHRLDQSRGVIAVPCSDGDRMFDVFEHLTRIQAGQRPGMHPLVHLLPRHGGALRLVKGAPVNRPGSTIDDDLMDEINAARFGKGINTIALYAHAPCMHTEASRVGLVQSLGLLLGAKWRVREAF